MASTSTDAVSCTCVLCSRVIEKTHERYLISGKSKFDVSEALKQLPFDILESSPYICRQCLDKLRKRSSLISQEKNIVNDLKEAYERGKLKRRQIFPEEGPSNKRTCVLTPISLPTPQTKAIAIHAPPVLVDIPTPIAHSTPVKNKAASGTSVNVTVAWQSQTRQRELQPDLQSLGKMLVRGTYKQIANAAWSNQNIRKHLVVNVCKNIDKECVGLCSKKNPSCLRSPSKEKILNFSFENQRVELEKRAPLLFSVLVAAGSTRNKREKKTWIPAVGMASSILLRNRSPYMNAIQLMLGIFLYHSNWAVSLNSTIHFYYSFLHIY